jgi:NAD(P)-dependent dehydrogenase (short-subunit alcohol dehydrogenase family)
MEVDVSSSASVNAAATEVVQLHGRVDALVNNAAVQLNAALLLTSDDDWARVLQNNLTGAFYCIRAMANPLREAGGAIVNVSSVHAVATSANAGAYAISKTALVGLTRATALELGPSGVRCNAVLPGAIDSPMLRDGLSRRSDPDGPDAALDHLRNRTPLRTIAAPLDIARSILFLADTERSPFVTGACLVADGGALLHLSTE